jgi:hypothetical protein
VITPAQPLAVVVPGDSELGSLQWCRKPARRADPDDVLQRPGDASDGGPNEIDDDVAAPSTEVAGDAVIPISGKIEIDTF